MIDNDTDSEWYDCVCGASYRNRKAALKCCCQRVDLDEIGKWAER